MTRIISGKLRLDVQPRRSRRRSSRRRSSRCAPRPTPRRSGSTRSLDPHGGPVFGDPNRLQQVVWNLLSNAVKFTPTGGTIDVVARARRGRTSRSRSRHGHGHRRRVPAARLRALPPGRRARRRAGTAASGSASRSSSTWSSCTAARCARRARARAGRHVRREPAARARSARTSTSEHPSRRTRRRSLGAARSRSPGVKVLVVDDEPDARELLTARARRRRRRGRRRRGSADEALELVRSTRPDVIVSDIGMPERDGYQLIRRRPRPPGGARAAGLRRSR